MIIKKIFFEATDGVNLFGLLHLPENSTSRKVVISTHGFSSSSVNSKRDDIIATTLTTNGFAYFCFDNRGSGSINRIKNSKIMKYKRSFGGACFDDILSGKFDILGAIYAMQEHGFEEFVLQGHSLGSAKTMMTYQALLEENNYDILNKIKGIMFLSPVDAKSNVLDENFYKTLKLAQEKVIIGEENYIIFDALLGFPLSAKAFCDFYKNLDEISMPIEFDGGEFEQFNKILCPILICHGESDITTKPTKEIVKVERKKIKVEGSKFVVISGANHSYHGKEKGLAKAILNFLKTL